MSFRTSRRPVNQEYYEEEEYEQTEILLYSGIIPFLNHENLADL